MVDDKSNVAEMIISVYDMVENSVGKEEKAGNQQCFQSYESQH